MFVGAVAGYSLGWLIVIRGAKTPYFQRMTHKAAARGATRNQFASFLGVKTAALFGVVALLFYGILYLSR
jgi:hypothetical protein